MGEAVPALIERVRGQVGGVQAALVAVTVGDLVLQVGPERVRKGGRPGEQRPGPDVEGEPRRGAFGPLGGQVRGGGKSVGRRDLGQREPAGVERQPGSGRHGLAGVEPPVLDQAAVGPRRGPGQHPASSHLDLGESVIIAAGEFLGPKAAGHPVSVRGGTLEP